MEGWLADTLQNIRSGMHIAYIHSGSWGDYIEIVALLIRGALDRGEKCLCEIAGKLPAEMREELEKRDPRIAGCLTTGQLRIEKSREAYGGAPFTPGEAAALLLEEARFAQEEGYAGLARIREMARTPERLLQESFEYGTELNKALPGSPVAVICLYDRTTLSTEALLEALKAHPFVMLGTTICRNPYFTGQKPLGGLDREDQLAQKLRYLELIAARGTSPSQQQDRAQGDDCRDGFGAREDQCLRVFCLGSLSIYRGKEKVSDWDPGRSGAKKVKALFAYLLTRGEKGAISQRLADLLWPYLPEAKASPRLRSTIHSLRRVLEPRLEPWEESSRIKREGDRCVLRLRECDWVDVQALEEHCLQAERLQEARDAKAFVEELLKAERLYQGHYMADIAWTYTENYEDGWCLYRRSSLQRMYLEVLLKLARHYLNEKSLDPCLHYARIALEEDSYCEEACRLLMLAFQQAGRPLDALREYRLYAEKLRQEGLGPGAAIASLSRRLRGQLATPSS